MTLSRIVFAHWLIAGAMMAPARAQPAGAQAEVLFREGRDLMKAGKTAEACAAFEQSQKLDPAVTTLINLAACREKLGQLATAWGLFLEAERQTRAATDPATQQLNKVATARAAKLEPRVPKLTINVPASSKVEGLEIRRDQESIPAVMWNRALPVDGGTYTITARAPGTADWSTRVTLAPETDAKTVDIPDPRSLPRDPTRRPDGPSGTTQPSQPSETPDPPGQRRSLLVPVAVGAGAVALLGGALGLSLWGDSTYDKAKAEMTDQARRDELYDSANRKRYAAQGFAVAGAASAGVAVWLYLRQRGSRAEPTPAAAARLMLAPTASGIGLAGRF